MGVKIDFTSSVSTISSIGSTLETFGYGEAKFGITVFGYAGAAEVLNFVTIKSPIIAVGAGWVGVGGSVCCLMEELIWAREES